MTISLTGASDVPSVAWEYWGWYETSMATKGVAIYGVETRRSECHQRLVAHYGITRESSKSVTDNLHRCSDAVEMHQLLLGIAEVAGVEHE